MGDCLPQPWGNLGACLLMEQQADESPRTKAGQLEAEPVE